MKEITWRNIDAVWFEVEKFEVKDVDDPMDDIVSIQNTDHHQDNEIFTVSTSRDAAFLAEKLLTRDDKYNYALIYLCRYNEKPEASEDINDKGTVDIRTLIGFACSEESEISREKYAKEMEAVTDELGI